MEEISKTDLDRHKWFKKKNREEFPIPPNKTVSLKTRYKRKKKSTKEYLEEGDSD
jgi:hypothetical protein